MPAIEPTYIFSECNFAMETGQGYPVRRKYAPAALARKRRQSTPGISARRDPRNLAKALRSRFSIRSYGTQEREIIEAYVAKQPTHHPLASASSQELFESLVIENKSVDLSRAKHAGGGVYWYNLHLALVHIERWRCANRNLLHATQDVIVRTCAKKGWQLSRFAIVPDHFHLAIGCSLDESPSDVVLALMNNISWVHGMKPILCHSAFMGTFGEYDQRSVVGRQRGWS
jgi:REP element-mobilizing transposase RayT